VTGKGRREYSYPAAHVYRGAEEPGLAVFLLPKGLTGTEVSQKHLLEYIVRISGRPCPCQGEAVDHVLIAVHHFLQFTARTQRLFFHRQDLLSPYTQSKGLNCHPFAKFFLLLDGGQTKRFLLLFI